MASLATAPGAAENPRFIGFASTPVAYGARANLLRFLGMGFLLASLEPGGGSCVEWPG